MALTHFTDAEVQSGGLDVLTEQILEVRAVAVTGGYCRVMGTSFCRVTGWGETWWGTGRWFGLPDRHF